MVLTSASESSSTRLLSGIFALWQISFAVVRPIP